MPVAVVALEVISTMPRLLSLHRLIRLPSVTEGLPDLLLLHLPGAGMVERAVIPFSIP
jgi:hypothetical protein